MYTTSNEYKNANLEAYRKFESRITIGNRIITNEQVVSINLQQSIQQEATFTIGNTISSILNLSFLHNDIETSDRDNVNIEIGLLVNGVFEYIPLGIFNIDNLNSNDTTTSIVAYDNMIKLDIPYDEEKNLELTVYNVINRLIELTGIEFEGPLSNYTNYNLISLSGYTCREVLGFVAGVLGCNVIIDRQGKFKFVDTTKTSSITITNENYFNYAKQSRLYKISKIVNEIDEINIEKGTLTDDTVCLYMSNPLVNDDILQQLYIKLNGFNFIPFELNWNGDLSLDLGDSIEIIDKKGTSLIQPILSQSFTYTGGLSSVTQAQGDTKLANTYTTNSTEENKIIRNGNKISQLTVDVEGITTRVGDLEDEDNVTSVKVRYYLSTSREELLGGTWLDKLPIKEEQQNKFLWFKYLTTYTNGLKDETEPVCISAQDGSGGLNGADGVDGKDGASLIYKGEFATHPSNPQNGWYYRNSKEKKTFVFQDNAWYQMTIDGQDGLNGKDGLSIEYKGELSNPPINPFKNWTYKDSDNGIVYIYTGLAWEVMTYDGNNGQDGADGQNGLSIFVTYNDSVTKPATPIGNGTTNGWHTNTTSSIVWMSQKVASSSTSGTWGMPIKIQGRDGQNGANGQDGVSVEEVIIQYVKGTSTSTAPTTGWDTSMPTYAEGYYLWIRTRVKYSNSNNYVYSVATCDQSWKANAEVYTQYKQLQNKFSWIVKGGTSASNMELTEKMYSLMTGKVLIEARKIELNGSININNGVFKVATNGNTKIGGLCTHINSDGTDRGIFEVTSTGTVYSRHKTNPNIYTMLTEGKITVKNNEGILTFENGQIKVSDGSTATTYGDGYIGHNLSIMVETPKLNCTQTVVANKFEGQTYAVLRANSDSALYLCCNDGNVGDNEDTIGVRSIMFFKNSNNDYVFRSRSKTGACYLGTSTYYWKQVASKEFKNTSDRTLKENVQYLSNSNYNLDNVNITINDLYNFVKNDLPIALYNYIGDNTNKIGFIAQDIIYNKDETNNTVGQLIVDPKSYNSEDGKLTYDLNNYVSVLAGALQVALNKIEKLEGLINGN